MSAHPPGPSCGKTGASLNASPDTVPENPFRIGQFRRLFAVGAGVSWIRWTEIFAFSLLTFDLTGSPFLVVVVGLTRMVPLMGGALVGTLASRFSPRMVIGASATVGMVVYALLIPVAATGRLAVWHLVVAAIVAGVALAVDFTIRRPLIGSVVDARIVGRAISADFVANTLARTLAPALTGALINGLGYTAVFVLGLAIYAAAFLGVLGLSVPTIEGEVGWAPMRKGYEFARRSPDVMAVVFATVIMNLFVFPFRHFVPVIGTSVLGLNPAQVGLLTAAEGVGMTIGSIALALWVHPRHFVRVVYGAAAFAEVAVIVFGRSTWLPLSVIAVIGVGLGVAGFATMQSAIVVDQSPVELRSPVMGMIGTLIGTNPLGLLLLGAFTVLAGPPGGIVISGGIGLGATLLSVIRGRSRPPDFEGSA